MPFSWLKKRIQSHLNPNPPPPQFAPPHMFNPSPPSQLAPPPQPSASPFAAEGLHLSTLIWPHFWSPQHNHFVTAHASSETVSADGGSWHGYTLWPFVIGIEALLEAEAVAPGVFAGQIHTALAAVEKFRCRDGGGKMGEGGYCAWSWFEGNKDVYYDDDAQLAIAFLRAYSLPSTRYPNYLTAATRIVDFLQTGWDHDRGGMRWHVAKPEARNACTTNLCAIAALKLAEVYVSTGNDASKIVEFARRCSDWTMGTLLNDQGLIVDGANGGPTWTYNTGTALYTLCLLHSFNVKGVAEKARALAEAACDRTKGLFDLSNPSPPNRFWWDSTFFAQLLIEGLVGFTQVFGRDFPETAARAAGEVQREAEYILRYLRGVDGMYVRGLRLYVVSQHHLEVYRQLTGDVERKGEWDQSERWLDEGSKKVPVGDRGICMTLLGNGGAARCLLLAGRIC